MEADKQINFSEAGKGSARIMTIFLQESRAGNNSHTVSWRVIWVYATDYAENHWDSS